MKDKLKTVARLWGYTFGVSLLTMVVFHLMPTFGTLFGDLVIDADNVRVPIVSCGLLSLVAVGFWAYANRHKL